LDIISSSRCESPLGVDPLIAQHCTLLPPELVSEQGILLPGLRTANFVATGEKFTKIYHVFYKRPFPTFQKNMAFKNNLQYLFSKI